MFTNKDIKIYSISDKYDWDKLLYSLKAQVYKGRKESRFDWVNSEHSVFQTYKVLVPIDKNEFEKWDLIKFTEVTWDVTLKIINGQEVPFRHNEKFIEITCDLV